MDFVTLWVTKSIRRSMTATVDLATEHQARARVALTAALASGPSHAYLFRGPQGSGKRAAARAFAAEILAGGAADPDDVRRRALLDPSPHPDLVWLAPRGAQHLVEEVRERVIRAAAYRPFEGAKRVFVVEAAEALRDESQNALLKTLEEPPAFVHLILLSSEPEILLETIASRCQPVDFAPLSAEVLEAELRADGPETSNMRTDSAHRPQEIAAAARLAAGDLERARLLLGPRGHEVREDVERCVAAALSGAVASAPWKGLLERAQAAGEDVEAATRDVLEEEAKAGLKRTARDIADESKRAGRRRRTQILDLGLELCAAWFRDLAAVSIGAEDVVFNRDRLDQLRSQASGLDPAGPRLAVEAIQETRRSLDLNVSEELALEALFFKLERTVSDAAVRCPQSPE
jgi:DNA polymerase-3 subunit delta'